MSWGAVIVGGVTLGAKLIGKGVAKRKAKKARKKAEAEIAKKTVEQKAEVAKGYAAQEGAEKDLAHVYEGASSIDPEAAQARDDNERATQSAVDKATRAGASSTEIMNMVSGLTGQGSQRARGISAETHNRRQQAMIAAKQQGVRAAQVGLAGKQAQVAVEDKGFSLTEMKNQQINQAAAMDYQATSDAINDAGGMAMMGINGMNSSGTGTSGLYNGAYPDIKMPNTTMSSGKGTFNSKRRQIG